MVLGFSCGGRSWDLPGKDFHVLWLSLYWAQPMTMSLSKAGKVVAQESHTIWDIVGVSLLCWLGASTGETQVLLLLFSQLPFFLPQHVFLSSFSIRVAAAFPACLHLPSSLPVFSLFSHANSTDGWWLQQCAQAYLPSSWRKLSKHWFVKGELLLFNNRHQAKQKEIGIDFLHISTQYFALESLILPETFHQWLIKVWEFVA